MENLLIKYYFNNRLYSYLYMFLTRQKINMIKLCKFITAETTSCSFPIIINDRPKKYSGDLMKNMGEKDDAKSTDQV